MHFISTLFNVQEYNLDPAGGSVCIKLNADHPIYSGHFPDNPITPGVCSLEIITQLIGKYYQGVDRPLEIEAIKFLGFINPLQTPNVRVELKFKEIEHGIWRVRGMLSTAQKTAVKVVARYEALNNGIQLKHHD